MEEMKNTNYLIGSNDKTDYSYGIGTLGKVINGKKSDRKTEAQIDLKQTQSIAVVGTRGSGKSNTVAVITEELLLNSLNVGLLIIDPLGAHRYLNQPNPNESQSTTLHQSGLEPLGFNSLILTTNSAMLDYKHFACGTFAIKTSDMLPEDWIKFWGFKPNSQQADLITVLIKKCTGGFLKIDGSYFNRCRNYSLENLIDCLNNDSEINDNGFIPATVNSIERRLQHLIRTGLFSTQGTSIDKIFIPGTVTVIDLSHPSISISEKSTIVGLIVRKTLQERLKSLGTGSELIPNSWIIVEESQLFTDDNLNNNATADIKNYIKTGRSAGCSIVLSTQQPSKIPTDIQSQLDIIISMRLNTVDDLNALRKCIPAAYYKAITSTKVISKLKPGQAFISDNCAVNNLRIVQVRPRLSRHGGDNIQSKQLTEVPITDNHPIESPVIDADQSTVDDQPKEEEVKNIPNKDCPVNKNYRISYLPGIFVLSCGFITTLLLFKYLNNTPNSADIAAIEQNSIEVVMETETAVINENNNKPTIVNEKPIIVEQPNTVDPEFQLGETVEFESKSINTDVQEDRSIMKTLLSSITLLENSENDY